MGRKYAADFEKYLSDWLARSKHGNYLRPFVQKRIEEISLWPQPSPDLPQIQETHYLEMAPMRLKYHVDSKTGVATILEVEEMKGSNNTPD